MLTATTITMPPRRFQVRDISQSYDGPTFDVIFHDDEYGVERYSEAIWSTRAEAQAAADQLEAAGKRPTHWDIQRPE